MVNERNKDILVTNMSYDSPLLPIPEILDCFRESNISLTENDVKNPDPRRWHEIYSRIFEALTDRPIENVIQSMLRVERMQTDYQDLFEEGFAQMAFTSCMQTVLCSFGFTSFSIRDVIQPTARRAHRLASIFVNAVRHIQGRRLNAQNILDDIQASRGQFESVLNTNQKLKELLANAKITQPQRDADSQKVQKEFDQERQAFIDLNKVQEEERRAMDELKLRVAELDADKESLKQQLTSVQLEAEKMSHKIVQSPKRFKKDLERFKNKVDDMKAELANKEQSLSENRLLLEQTVNKLTAVVKVVKLNKEVQCDQETKNELDAELGCLTEAMHEQKEWYNSHYLQEENLAEKLRVRQEQKHKLSSQIDLWEHSNCQQLTDLRNHHEKLKEEIKQSQMETSQFSAANIALCKEFAELENILEDRKEEFRRALQNASAEILAVEEFVSQGLTDLSDTMLTE